MWKWYKVDLRMRNSLIVGAAVLACAVAIAAVLQGRARSPAAAVEKSQQQAAAAVPILVATAEAKDVLSSCGAWESFVYVVKDDSTVDMRPVKVSRPRTIWRS